VLALAPTRPAARAARWLWSTVRAVPGTLVWLAAIAVTSGLAERMSNAHLDQVLVSQSTNLANLAGRPLEVMVGSALWDDHGAWWFLVVFGVFHARVERWLGTARWLAVVFGAHVIGTLVSQGFVALAIRYGSLPATMAATDDYGVSYTLAGAIALLAYRLAPVARAWYVALVLAIYTGPFWAQPLDAMTFTDIGHLTAVLVGLSAWPLVRRHARADPWTRPTTAGPALVALRRTISSRRTAPGTVAAGSRRVDIVPTQRRHEDAEPGPTVGSRASAEHN